MAYTENPAQQAQMRQQIRSIIEEKMTNPLYKGEGLKGSPELENRVQNILTEINKEQSKKHPYLYSKDSADSMGYGIADYMVGPKKTKAKNPRKVKSGKKSAKFNPWIVFLKKWMKDHPNVTGRAALKGASDAYKKSK